MDLSPIIAGVAAFTLFGLLVGREWRRRKRRKRVRQGRCLHCGYVLHGVEGVLCPECGKNTQPENADNAKKMEAGISGGGPYVPPTP